MTLLFAMIIIALVLAMQRRTGGDRLADMREDHRPDECLVDPDERFHVELTLQNTGRHYILFARLEEHLDRAFQIHDPDVPARPGLMDSTIVSYSTWLRPRQEVRFRIPVSISARGLYPLAPLTLFSGDFLGLDTSNRRSGQFRAVVVAPREAEDQRFADALSGFLGAVSVRRFIHEDPVLTTGFREYTGREPMKQISWTQSARGRGLMVKNFDHTAEPRVSVLLNADTQAEDKAELLERCCSMARTVCRILEEQGVQYDFATNAGLAGAIGSMSREVGAGLGASHFTAVLDCLGRIVCRRSFSSERLLAENAESALTRGCILITPSDDFAGSQALEQLRRLSGGNVIILQAGEVCHDRF